MPLEPHWCFVVLLLAALICYPIDGATFYPLCEFVASTNIELVHSEWSCSTTGDAIGDPCTWSGVTCVDNNIDNVTSLVLSNETLIGTLPLNIGVLDALTSLHINHTGIVGVIPPRIGCLSTLVQLSLTGNELSHAIPTTIGCLRHLKILDLHFNRLHESEIPTELGLLSELLVLDLSENLLKGTLSSRICEFPYIIELNIGGNKLTGTIPSQIGCLRSLNYLNVGHNNFTALLPTSIGELSQLVRLDIGENYLFGTLPSVLFGLSELTVLNANHNSFTGSIPETVNQLHQLENLMLFRNCISGTLPLSLFTMTQLTALQVHQNRISSTIPSQIGSLTNLYILRLHSNHFTGPFPAAVTELEKLRVFEVYTNHITGSLPVGLGNLVELLNFNCGHTHLHGTIPEEVGSLVQLVEFTTMNTEIGGTIPSSFARLTNLRQMILAIGRYSGTIPSGLGSLIYLQVLELSTNFFSGVVPSELGSLSDLTVLEMENNKFTGTLPEMFDSKFYLISVTLNNNHFTGNVPSTLGLSINLVSLDLSNNYFTGPLPASLGGAVLVNLDVNSNTLTGTIPDTLLASPLLLVIALFENSLTGALPTEIGFLFALDGLALSHNYLSGTVPSELNSLSILRFVDLEYNAFTGPVTFLNPENLEYANLSHNKFSGSLPSIMCSVIDSLAFDYNPIIGEIPTALASLSLLNKVSFAGTSVTGSIPSAFCGSTGMSINVTNTAVRCYDGCLTSAEVIIYGASDQCHDGSIMFDFFSALGLILGVAVIATIVARASICAESGEVETGSVSAWNYLSRTRNPVVAISVFKVALVVGISLGLNNWWMYASSSAVVDSCSNPDGDCYSFCGASKTVSVAFTDDDFFFDDLYVPPALEIVSHESTADYCIAELMGTCAYKYWMVFKLVPLLLHFVQLAMQFLMWHVCDDFTPQQKQYDIVIAHLYPTVWLHFGFKEDDRKSNDESTERNSNRSFLASRLCMIDSLKTPGLYNIFAFIEMLTALYVWGELLFPSTFCGAARPLSLYYYPILMSIAELIKFNIYVCMRYAASAKYFHAVAALLNMELFATNLWVSLTLAVYFASILVFSLWEFIRSIQLLWYKELSGTRTEWPKESECSVGVELEDASTSNPIIAGPGNSGV